VDHNSQQTAQQQSTILILEEPIRQPASLVKEDISAQMTALVIYSFMEISISARMGFIVPQGHGSLTLAKEAAMQTDRSGSLQAHSLIALSAPNTITAL
jgi:hypothetical protein